jgi:hypothetical protein
MQDLGDGEELEDDDDEDVLVAGATAAVGRGSTPMALDSSVSSDGSEQVSKRQEGSGVEVMSASRSSNFDGEDFYE